MKRAGLFILTFGLLSLSNAWSCEDQHKHLGDQTREEQEEVIADPEDYPAIEDSGQEVSREAQVEGPDIFEPEDGNEDFEDEFEY